eukprot:4464094-Prymnesium_polylepis.1
MEDSMLKALKCDPAYLCTRKAPATNIDAAETATPATATAPDAEIVAPAPATAADAETVAPAPATAAPGDVEAGGTDEPLTEEQKKTTYQQVGQLVNYLGKAVYLDRVPIVTKPDGQGGRAPFWRKRYISLVDEDENGDDGSRKYFFVFPIPENKFEFCFFYLVPLGVLYNMLVIFRTIEYVLIGNGPLLMRAPSV